MSDIDILHQMIREAAKVSLVDKYYKKQVTLTEPQQSNSVVTIYGIPDNAIVIKADAFKSPDTVFNCSKQGECKRADFVIIAETGKRKVIICVEMKTTKASAKEIIQQLTGVQCFIAYCQEIGKAFWNKPDFLKDYVYRFVSIGHTSIPKKKTRIDRPPDTHDRPDKMLKIAWPHHLQFNQLVGDR